MIKYLIFTAISLAVYLIIIPLLKRLKGYQVIYALTPPAHQKKKKTLSFGGSGILISTFTGLLIFNNFSPKIWWSFLLCVSFAVIGFIDDVMAFRNQDNEGLKPYYKFLLQSIVAVIFISYFDFTFSKLVLWQYIFYWFVIVGASNATNLSDGLDGLLAGLSIITFSGFYLWFGTLNFILEQKLSIIFIISIAIFLIFNMKPARIFMGDTGSLALGAIFAALSIVGENPLVLIPLGAVYIVEALSVIIQVSYFKIRKKRVFLMAPIHHHFELLGLSERKTVFLFWLTGTVFLLIFLVMKQVIQI
ncbi:MAG: phospho-N-acetylmuramoyl-pentapeptide-transferase [bacterium]|nr:phospho-N-acetylmuramoyl-pentapeptide-transferase [bacterium]